MTQALPEPSVLCDCGGNYYTAVQVRLCVDEALEAAAKLCESNQVEKPSHGQYRLAPFDKETLARHDGITYAAAIRALKETK